MILNPDKDIFSILRLILILSF